MNAVVENISSAFSGWSGRTFIWLIKRELWEHRSRFLITPLVIGGVIILGVLYALTIATQFHGSHISINGMAGFESGGASPTIHSAAQYAVYLIFSVPFLLVTSLVTGYYALDALYADRRDRSILFWKSLPISDLETVVSKLTIASIVAPIIAMAVSIVTQVVVFVVISIALVTHGHSAAPLWVQIPILENIAMVLYALVVMALWYLPVVAWFLLASAWAQRAVFLWATVPIGVVWFLERQTLGTNYVGELLRSRLGGGFKLAITTSRELFENSGIHMAGVAEQTVRGGSQLATSLHFSDVITPGVFFSSPQLWLGLLAAIALVALTVWVRRYRDPA